MVLFDGYGPRIVALNIILSIQVVSILFMPYFYFRSVRPKLQASSGRIGEAVRATQRQQYWRYIAETANIIGAAWLTALIGEAGKRSPHLQAKRGEFVAPIQSFRRFFKVRCASPICGTRIAVPIVLAQHKENERIGEARETIRSASPIVIEIAYLFSCTDRKRKYLRYETTAN